MSPSLVDTSRKVEIYHKQDSSTRNLTIESLTENHGENGISKQDSNKADTIMNSPSSDFNILMQRLNRIAPGPFNKNGQRELLKLEKQNYQKATTSNSTDISVGTSMTATHDRLDMRAARPPGHIRSTSASSLNIQSSYAVPPQTRRKENYVGFGPPICDPNVSTGSGLSKTTSLQVRNVSRPQNDIKSIRPVSPVSHSIPTHKSSIPKDWGDNMKNGPLFNESIYQAPSRDDASSILSPETFRNKNMRQRSLDSVPMPLYHPRKSSKHSCELPKTSDINSDRTDPTILKNEIESKENPVRLDSKPLKSSIIPSSPEKFLPTKNEHSSSTNEARRPSFPEKAYSGKNENNPPINPAGKPPREGSRTLVSKGKCKKCGHDIYGKSVTSADGRLSGRYHKNCFVCQSCNVPFKTKTFYILEDAPYCEMHYHERNHSLCCTCNLGIEGQYIATEDGQIHHPTCLKCAECHQVLSRDYFELNGKLLCERDALRIFNPNKFYDIGKVNNNRRLERRMTRLIMI